MINSKTSIKDFFENKSYQWDKWVFVLVCVICFLGLISLVIGQNFILLREFDFKNKAAILLMFSPVIVFLLWFCLALLPFSKNFISKVLRIFVYLIFVLLFNF